MAFLGIAWGIKKSFCSWICPVSLLSEYLWKAGRKIFGRNVNIPAWLDWPGLTMKTFTKIMSTPGDVEDMLKTLTE